MSKDDIETETMNELFKSDDEEPRLIHWVPVAIYHDDGEKIRNLTKEEQIKWIKEQKEKMRR